MKMHPHKPPKNEGPGRPKLTRVKNPGPTARLENALTSLKIVDIFAAVAGFPDVRDVMVREIKQRIASGTYTICPHKIAEKMLKSF